MRTASTISTVLLAVLTLYCGSYFVLRCTGMRFGASRHSVHGVIRTTTYVYFGNGDNSATRAARVIYFPMHTVEHAWLLWRHTPVGYD